MHGPPPEPFAIRSRVGCQDGAQHAAPLVGTSPAASSSAEYTGASSRRSSSAPGSTAAPRPPAVFCEPDTPQKARQQPFISQAPHRLTPLPVVLSLAGLLLSIGLLVLLMAATPMGPLARLHAPYFSSSAAAAAADVGAADTLVLYLYSNSEPEYAANLRYFLEEAVVLPGSSSGSSSSAQQREHYVIIVQTADDLETTSLPELPPNARYVFHQNSCYDWGTFGWLLRSGVIDTGQYMHFFFINSSVRGPFLPSYLRGKLHWTTPFISQLSDQVKLVGPVISCEGSPWRGDASGTWRRNPHVQSYALATDRDGLQVLLDDPHVFECHSDRWDAIWYSELGSSAAILKAGYNLASFMIRYQGIDWRDVGTWGCNGGGSPAGEAGNDGQTLDPYEVMFVKFKSSLGGEPAVALARKYQHWQEQQLQQDDWDKDTNDNEYSAKPQLAAAHKLPKVLMALRRGSGCFDVGYYLAMSPDVRARSRGEETAAFKHWVFHGQFEDRPFRFVCDDLDYAAIAAPPV